MHNLKQQYYYLPIVISFHIIINFENMYCYINVKTLFCGKVACEQGEWVGLRFDIDEVDP